MRKQIIVDESKEAVDNLASLLQTQRRGERSEAGFEIQRIDL